MVTFFCDNCGSTEKKKQAERHIGFCGGPMSCIQCKVIFKSLCEIKLHTQCGNIPPKPRPQPKSKGVSFYEKHLEKTAQLTKEEEEVGSKIDQSYNINYKNASMVFEM